MQAILHCDRNWGIGKRNDLMFRLPKDMKFFRTATTGKVVVMGSIQQKIRKLLVVLRR